MGPRTIGRRAVDLERRLFMRINDAPGTRALRVPQQVGTPWALAVAAALLAVRGEPSRAAAAVLTLPLVKGSEVAIKETLRRRRPLYVVPTELRDDAPVEGGSFPSGHSAIAVAATWLVQPVLPVWAGRTLWAMSAANGYVRVHQGAHWPTDVVGGAALGLGVARSSVALCRRLREVR